MVANAGGAGAAASAGGAAASAMPARCGTYLNVDAFMGRRDGTARLADQALGGYSTAPSLTPKTTRRGRRKRGAAASRARS